LRYDSSNFFTALDFKAEAVIGKLRHWHWVIAFCKFLGTIDQRVPTRFEFHRIIDNYASHKTAVIQR